MKLSKSDRDRYVETQRLIRQAAEDRMQAWIDEARDERIAESYRDINDVPQWVAYRMEERNGRFTKVPVNPVTGGNAQTNNPSTWGTLAQAQAAAARYGTDGVGFVFANGYFGIDLDHVIDPENKTIKQYAQDIIDTMASYTEISPSGTGVHIIARGDPVLDSNVNKSIGIEIYYPTMQDDGSIRRGRYFTVTGNSYGPVRPVSERTEQAQDIWKRYVDGKPTYPGTMVSAADNLGLSNDVSAMVDYAYGLSTQYGEASSALACEMYDALAEAQGASVPPAEPAATATYDETAKAVSGTMKNRRNSVPDTVSRLVKQAGADTMLQNAKRDRAEFAWVPRGDTCAFCIMLASNGWQYQSKNAMKNGHASHIHANCDCEYVVRFDGKSTVEGYDPDEYLAMYENAEGATWKEKVNSMRREQYAEDKDRINAQKRAAYAAKKGHIGEWNRNIGPDSWNERQRKFLHEDELKLLGLDHEEVKCYDRKGRFQFWAGGDRTEVHFTERQMEQMKGGILTHNHPGKNYGCFSPEDLFMIHRGDLTEIRCITPAGVFRAQKPKKWPDDLNTLEKIRSVYYNISNEIGAAFYDRARTGEITFVDADNLWQEASIRELCSRYDIPFELQNWGSNNR